MKISRRDFIRLGMYSIPALGLADGFLIEPSWLRVRKISLHSGTRQNRIVHITDLHYCGDTTYLERVVRSVNALQPDFVCFTGDIVEERRYLDSALAFLGKVTAPLYGVPGNHEYSSGVSFDEIARCFRSTGGDWLLDEVAVSEGGAIKILGSTEQRTRVVKTDEARGANRIVLTHYPEFVDKLRGEVFTLILAGHSHGGQIRIPLWGAPILPRHVGRYDLGLFQTPSGPLYVNPGIGTYHLPVRLNCRPEITLFEI